MEEDVNHPITASDLSISCPPRVLPGSSTGNSNHSISHTRKTSGQQHVILSIQPAENTQETQRIALLRYNHSNKEDGSKGSPCDQTSSQNKLASSHSSDKEVTRRAKAPTLQRELRDVDINLRNSAQSYIEASTLLSNERDTFRNCALELLWEMDKTAYPIQFEEGAEIIKCGILLKKASKNPFKRWKQKFVVVTVGHLYWFPIDSSAAANGVVAITEKMRKNRHEMILDENTEPRCSLSRKKNVHHVFDVIHKSSSPRSVETFTTVEQLHQYIQSSCYSSSDPQPCQLESHPSIDDEDTIEKHFMCQTDEERDSWLRALRHSRLGRDNDPTAWFSQHVFHSVQTLAQKAQSTEEVCQILSCIKDIPLCIPIHFIQRLSSLPQTSTKDPQLNQVMKDLNRETVILGERSFQATLGDSDTYGFSSKIMFLLMESIRRVDKSLQSMDVLRMARKVLLHTYRSQTGGDCYDAIITLLSQSNHIMILPENIPSSKNPIQITVKDEIPDIRAIVNKEGPYVLSSIDNYFVIADRSRNPLFGVKATVNSIISKDNKDDPWTLKLVFSSK